MYFALRDDKNERTDRLEVIRLRRAACEETQKWLVREVQPDRQDEGRVTDRSHRVCPVEASGSLDNRIRRWLQNPQRLLGRFVQEGMTILDLGCGPGFFTLEMARMVGPSGRVVAADLQDGMLQKVRSKIRGTELEDRVTLHECSENGIGLSETVDFILAFYVVHEVPRHPQLFAELVSILNRSGRLVIVEPPFHVSRKAFEETIGIACAAGLIDLERPRMFLNKAALLGKALH